MNIIAYQDINNAYPGKKGTLDPNIRSAVCGFRKWRECNLESALGDEWTSDPEKWEQLLKEYLSSLVGNIKKGSIANISTVLASVRRRVIAEIESPAGSTDTLTGAASRAAACMEFGARVRAARIGAGLTQREVAKRLGTLRESYACWEKGRIPRNHERLAALEKALDLTPGALGVAVYATNWVPGTHRSILSGSFGKEWQSRMLNEDFKYAAKLEDIEIENPPLYCTVRKWLDHKTSELPCRGRDRGRRWCTSSEGIAVTAIESFFGCMRALGKPLSDAHILDLFDEEKIDSFLKYMKGRNGTYITAIKHIKQVFCSALTKDRGFFTAWWDLFFDDPVVRSRCGFEETSNGTKNAPNESKKNFEIVFKAFCEKTRKSILLTAAQAAVADGPHMARDPKEPIRTILDSASPVDFLFDLADRLEADKLYRVGADPYFLAVQHRDIAVIHLMIRIPLRIRTMVRWLSWREDNTGTFRHDTEGKWLIDLPAEAFKNIRGAAKNGYRVYVPESVAALVLNYIKNWRHLHITPDFIAKANADIEKNEPKHRVRKPDPIDPRDRLFGFSTAKGMSARMAELSARYLRIQFRAHAFRHIVATDFLKKFPKEYVRLANLLNDTLKVVMDTYADKDEARAVLPYHERLDSERRTGGRSV